MTGILEFLRAHGADILQALAGIIAGASVLANFTKTDRDDKALSAVARCIHFLAANFFMVGGKKAK